MRHGLRPLSLVAGFPDAQLSLTQPLDAAPVARRGGATACRPGFVPRLFWRAARFCFWFVGFCVPVPPF